MGHVLGSRAGEDILDQARMSLADLIPLTEAAMGAAQSPSSRG